MPVVNFWGVQGSCPGTIHKENLGSNTSCVTVSINDTLIIFDAGTGIQTLSLSMDLKSFKKVILCLTHSHWDHIQGFPYFNYLYQKKTLSIFSHNKSHINGTIEQSMESILRNTMTRFQA